MTSRAAASRYGRALFDVVLKDGQLNRARDDLAGFAGLLSAHEALARVLSNPAVPVQRKRALVEELVARAGEMSPMVARLLLLLAERDRLVLLPEIVRVYEDRLMDHAHVVRAELVTAMPLPPEQLQALRAGLARATGRDVQLESRVDPSILGGAVARVGSTVYDGSVTGQLARLKQQLLEADT